MPCIQNDSSSQDFYTRTVAALDKKEISDQEVAQKLQQAKDAAKVQELVGVTSPQRPIAANIEDQNPVQVKAPVHSEEGDRDGLATEVIRESAKSVAGRKTMKGGEHRDMHSGKGAAMVSNREKGKTTSQKEGKEEKVESKEEHEVEMELNSILKKGPSRSKFS